MWAMNSEVGYKVVIYAYDPENVLLIFFCIITELKIKLSNSHREVKDSSETQLLCVFISTSLAPDKW